MSHPEPHGEMASTRPAGTAGSGAGARVDVVIACHTPTRPVGRAVASVLDGNGEHAGVVLVAHGIPGAQLEEVLEPRHRGRVRVLEHHAGVRSPAGPFNAGMRAAQGEFVSLLGSDDQLLPGAVASWLALADGRPGGREVDCVISRLALGEPDRVVPTPPVRPWLRRGQAADLVKDRLSYRSAPLGLVRRATRECLGAELVEGLVVGDDVPYVTRLWAETTVLVDRDGPPYLVGEDAGDRITLEARPIAQELAFVRHLLRQSWFRGYAEDVRTAVATKLLRIHVFGAVLYRPDPGWWTARERADLAAVVTEVLATAPRAARPLSRADHDLLVAALDDQVPAQRLVALARARRRHGRPRTLIPASWSAALHPEAPVPFMAASLAARHRPAG